MRAATFRARQEGGFHSISQRIAQETTFESEEVEQFNILEDGTAVVLCQVSGDLDRARELFGDHPDVLSSTITGEGDGAGLSYMHVRPPETITNLIELPREHEVVFDFPIEGIRADEIRVTMIGESDDTLQQAMADIPEEIDVMVERVRPYPSSPEKVSGMLTERQREILDIAVDLGYYQVPREATHADIAERAELDPGTVSEHMQKIESRVFDELAG